MSYRNDDKKSFESIKFLKGLSNEQRKISNDTVNTSIKKHGVDKGGTAHRHTGYSVGGISSKNLATLSENGTYSSYGKYLKPTLFFNIDVRVNPWLLANRLDLKKCGFPHQQDIINRPMSKSGPISHIKVKK